MIHRPVLFVVLALAASPVVAQVPSDQRTAADSAKAFSLDLPAPADPMQTLPPRAPEGRPQTLVSFTLDTPIEQLLADPRARAVLDADLPGMSADSNLAKFQLMSLRQLQPMTGGQMTNALLEKTGADLAAIAPSAETSPPMAPATVSAATRKKMDSGR